MNKTKAILGFVMNFLLGALGVAGLGWIILLAFPKAAKTVYIVGSILFLMCLWTAFDEMRKKLKKQQIPSSEQPTQNENKPDA